MIRLAVVVLVDPQGRLLIQERDEHAPIAPDQWGMVGGHVEEGEDVEPAAYRELEEETGVRLEPGTLTLWRDEVHALRGRARAAALHRVGRADPADRRRHRGRRGAADRVRRTGRRAHARPGLVQPALPAAAPDLGRVRRPARVARGLASPS